jgi:hypothetical protein
MPPAFGRHTALAEAPQALADTWFLAGISNLNHRRHTLPELFLSQGTVSALAAHVASDFGTHVKLSQM